ncbi:MAG: hypothetical protein OXE94_05015 [Aestuariivita sp.]|nr:hypothetical protein [Aestuariivita sp.]MCY4201940.1 hypothetical protein [Aestuariivita sp.]MCY4288826.1 hypothetical protein [Aestuariivita sp.]MCY4345253.1 hypothetical protein [Aestuariivita sp.]
MTKVWGAGSLRKFADIKTERKNLLDHLRAGDAPSDRSIVWRLFQAFTYREIKALLNLAETDPESLPSIAANDRGRVSHHLAKAIPTSYRQSTFKAWHEAEKQLQIRAHPKSTKEREGISLGW